jgi:DNA-binding PadR family transcriptional regulator
VVPRAWQPRGVERRPTLSVNEWAVLGVLADGDRHGYDIAAALQRGTPIGDAWRLPRQLVYRALERLEALGLVEPHRTEASASGPPRTIYGTTDQGRATLEAWLATPVEHIRDVRNAFLLKLLIAQRLGIDTHDLVAAQRHAFTHLLASRADPPPTSDVVATWRHHSTMAVAGFLDALDPPDSLGG